MLYQKMLLSSNPYFLSVSPAGAFEVHRHPEIEISFCLEGEYDLICENEPFSLKEGDFLVVSPMAAHELPAGRGDCKKLTIEIGSALLGENFDFFKNLPGAALFFQKAETLEYQEIIRLMKETATLWQSELFYRDLAIRGNLYKISSLLLQMISFSKTEENQNKKVTDIKKIDSALEKIYNSYYEPLTLESVSAFCGYGKSNFCKIFKNITGDTFHHTLNRHRIEVACLLLRESDRTIEEIARETGFADSKSFCRVFHRYKGQNAGAYRKRISPSP